MDKVWKSRQLWTAVADGVFVVGGAWAAYYAPADMRALIATTLVATQGVVVAVIVAFTVEDAQDAATERMRMQNETWLAGIREQKDAVIRGIQARVLDVAGQASAVAADR